MKKLLLAACLLLSNLTTLAMDDSLIYPKKLTEQKARESNDKEYSSGGTISEISSDIHANVRYLKASYIPYMLTLKEMHKDIVMPLEQMLVYLGANSHLAQQNFPALMTLLDDCIPIMQQSQTKGLNALEKSGILKHIMTQQYPIDQMVAMLNLIVYFEIKCLHDPMLDALLPRLIETVKTDKSLTAYFLRELPQDQQDILKEKLPKQYHRDLWVALGRKIDMVSLPATDILHSNGKFFVFSNSTNTGYILRDRYGKCIHEKIEHPHLRMYMFEQFRGRMSYDNDVFGVRADERTVKLWFTPTGEFIKEITLENLKKLTSDTTLTHIKSIKCDNGLFAICTNSSIILLETNDLVKLFAVFKPQYKKSNIHLDKISFTPDKTRLIVESAESFAGGQMSLSAPLIMIFDIALRENLSQATLLGDVIMVTNDTIMTEHFDGEFKQRITYDINTLKLIGFEKNRQPPLRRPPLLDTMSKVHYSNDAKALVAYNMLNDKSRIIRPLSLDFLHEPRIHVDTGVIILTQTDPRNFEKNCFLFSLWPYLKKHTLMHILELMTNAAPCEDAQQEAPQIVPDKEDESLCVIS